MRMKSDPNLYVHSTKKLYVLAYVDDLMFFGSRPDIDLCVQDLQKDLLLKMTGTLTEGQTVTFLGREIRRTADACELYMKPEYIDSMLQLYNMSACKPAAAPSTDTLRKAQEAQPLSAEDHKRYRRVVGQLLWLCNVRPDIMLELSRGLSALTSEHECKAKHLLRFLAGTKHFKQQLRPTLTLSRNTKASTYKSLSTVTGPGVTKPAGQLLVFRFLFLEPTSFRTVVRKRPLLCLREKQNFMQSAPELLTRFSFVPWLKNPSFSRNRTSLSALTATLARALFRALEHPAKRSMCIFGFFTCKNLSCPAWFACIRFWVR